MNYIKQLTAALEKFTKDDRLNPTHISLYLALFQYWNLSRFSNPISISRNEIMQLSKIGSKVTYHKCIKELHYWSYLEYRPSHNPFKGSTVMMFNFCTASKQAPAHNSSDNGQALIRTGTKNGQALIPSKTYTNSKPIKSKRRPKKTEEVEIYFLEKKSNKLEAQKFFNYYESNGWKVGGKTAMKDWKAAARNWILKTDETSTAQVQKRDNLNTSTDKDYGAPL